MKHSGFGQTYPDLGSAKKFKKTVANDDKTYYAWGGSSVIAEYKETASQTTMNWAKSYIYAGSRLLSTITKNGASETTEYQHPDRLGTKLVTNTSLNTAKEQATLPFGTEITAETQATSNQRFTSYDRSGATGLDYAVNRTYNSGQSRFTQVDPIGMASASIGDPQSMNLFAYTGNNPVDFVGPSGLYIIGNSEEESAEDCSVTDDKGKKHKGTWIKGKCVLINTEKNEVEVSGSNSSIDGMDTFIQHSLELRRTTPIDSSLEGEKSFYDDFLSRGAILAEKKRNTPPPPTRVQFIANCIQGLKNARVRKISKAASKTRGSEQNFALAGLTPLHAYLPKAYSEDQTVMDIVSGIAVFRITTSTLPAALESMGVGVHQVAKKVPDVRASIKEARKTTAIDKELCAGRADKKGLK